MVVQYHAPGPARFLEKEASLFIIRRSISVFFFHHNNKIIIIIIISYQDLVSSDCIPVFVSSFSADSRCRGIYLSLDTYNIIPLFSRF